jgi:hypothetical protein
MTERQAKHHRKLHQALRDIVKAMPDSYTLEQAQADLERLRGAGMADGKKLSTKLIAGLVKWQMGEM